LTVATGRLGWVGIDLESSAGAPKVPAAYLPFIECTLRERQTPIPDTAAYGIRDAQSENSQLGRQWGEGNLRINLDPTNTPYLLGMALGDFGSPTSEGGGVYTHTLVRLNSNAPKTASITFDRVTDRQLFTYAVVNSLEMAYSDGLAEINASLLSRMPVASTSGTLVTASGTLFTFRHATVKLGATVTAAENSATPLKLREFNLTINNDAELQFVSGNRDADSIIQKNFIVSGSFRLAFESTTHRDTFRNLSKQAMVVTFTGNGIGNAMSEYIKVRIYKMRFENYEVDVPIDDMVGEEISFIGEYDSTTSKTLDVVARNRKSSY
jgi:hypothetical protein